jgi:hypothetical protein
MPYCINLRSRIDGSISGWYDGSASWWSTDHTRRKVFDIKREARTVCCRLRSLCSRNPELINIEAEQEDRSFNTVSPTLSHFIEC